MYATDMTATAAAARVSIKMKSFDALVSDARQALGAGEFTRAQNCLDNALTMFNEIADQNIVPIDIQVWEKMRADGISTQDAINKAAKDPNKRSAEDNEIDRKFAAAQVAPEPVQERQNAPAGQQRPAQNIKQPARTNIAWWIAGGVVVLSGIYLVAKKFGFFDKDGKSHEQ